VRGLHPYTLIQQPAPVSQGGSSKPLMRVLFRRNRFSLPGEEGCSTLYGWQLMLGLSLAYGAVDEAKIKADGEWRYVWAAIDVDTHGLLAIWFSWQ